MDAVSLRAEIEAEWTWRLDELRFLKNQTANIVTDDRRDQYRRSLVMMLYAHFEGFCKAALSVYATAINNDALRVRECTPAIGAASLAGIFNDLRNSDRKSDFFRRRAPDDSGLHRTMRDREFVERISESFDILASIDIDATVDMESNVSPIVLQKILYRLGMDPSEVAPWSGQINKLLGRRNAVAHGEGRGGIDLKTFSELEAAVIDVVDKITRLLFQAANKNAHRRAAPPVDPP